MTDIQAQAVQFDAYGGLDVLYLADVTVPQPPAGEAVVAVRAAGINPGEIQIRSGALHGCSRRPSPPDRAATWPGS